MRRLVSLVVVFSLFAGTFAFAKDYRLPTEFVFKNDSKMTMNYFIRPMWPYSPKANPFIKIVAIKPGKTFRLTVDDLNFGATAPSEGDPVRIFISASPITNKNIRKQYNDLIFVKRFLSERERCVKVKLRF